FESYSSNLAPPFSGVGYKILVRDRDADGDGVFDEPGLSATTRVDVDALGRAGDAWSLHPWISADGRFVSFHSDASDLVVGEVSLWRNVFVRDLVAGTTTRVSVDSAGNAGNGPSQKSALSGDGRFVVFTSRASNLVASDLNQRADVFVHDRASG